MRVLHITRDFPPRSAGGISTAVGDLVRAQRAAQVEAQVISFDDWRPSRQRTAASLTQPVDGVVRIHAPSDLDAAAHFAELFRPTVLHAHHAMLWPWTAQLRQSLGVPAVKTIHVIQSIANEFRGVDETESSRCQQQALLEADRILVASQAAAAALAGRFPTTQARLRYCPFGVSDHSAARPDRTPERDPNLIAYAGRFDDMKGTDVLFDMMVDVLEHHPSAHFEIAGGVPLNQRSDARWRRQLAECLAPSLEPRVTLRGWLEPGALRDLFRRAAIVVAPSRFETFGMTVAEAMHEGAAVVGSYGTAHGELIENDRTGKLVAPGDPSALTEAVVALLRAPELTRRIASTAAAEIRQTYSWDRALTAHLSVYAEAAASRI